ncbi:Serine/threonine protein kinase [Handroanthus impetiginosus]|uniref:Serine/threonine protein kinase n=1 Tax=Handroanthus impetiginosus TaxID=429701 RepID=A0A2G9HNF0_9LAMI|nr:Serine/threonine protein kinase [Handroanthus impetiginosus]
MKSNFKISSKAASPAQNGISISNFSLAKPNCRDHCGNIRIPYPFGLTEECSLNKYFLITCKKTSCSHRLQAYLMNSIHISNISLDGQIGVLQQIAHDCFAPDGTSVSGNIPSISLPDHYIVSHKANAFTVIRCDIFCFLSGRGLYGSYSTGCNSRCSTEENFSEGLHTKIGYCQSPIPRETSFLEVELYTFGNYTKANHFNNCGYAFVDVKKLPIVVDWVIENKNCLEAQKSMSSYACKSSNSRCSDPGNGSGYRCLCREGYEANPYLPHDIDECKDTSLNNCKGHCENTEGSYTLAPKGIALGIIALILAACWTYFELRRRKLIKLKQTFFLQNGSLLLQEKLKKRDRSSLEMVKIFTSSELKKATNNFDESMIIGKGRYGTVFKGALQDNKIVAVERIHLLGCCLETQVPLLVYEFIGNGMLYENIHNKDKSRFLSWEKRLKIAAETAGILSYLHSAASTPIIHRDIKSANILLDALFTAKVSDFGASRLPEEEINLANFFLYTLRKDHLFEIIEGNIVCDETREQIIEVCKLAKKCLNIRGDDRPTMKEVAMELDALRLGGRNSWAKDEDDQEEIESRFGKGLDSISFSDDYSDSITVQDDSMRSYY